MPTKIFFALIFLIATTLTAAPRRRAASPDRCSAIVSPVNLSFAATGGHAFVAVTMSGGCAWSPVASDSWVTAAPASGGVSVDVAANAATTSRTALIHVRGAVVIVTQAANQLPNLLSNGGFDSNLDGWSNAFSGAGSVTWTAGTALITSMQTTPGYQLSQCVSVIGGKTYEAGTKTLIPSGQSAGVTNIGVYEYWVPSCPSLSAPYHGNRVQKGDSAIGAWFNNNVTWSTDFATKSVLVVIGAGGSMSPPFRAYFDDVFIREKP
ncbi:MAG TPA: BACON domain-containing protein [Thermoanaerobaculia bacterium]|jgi:hypothetical protein|nr:BACON domain-containing protein [Thermoanaerobaculia bacterium]